MFVDPSGGGITRRERLVGADLWTALGRVQTEASHPLIQSLLGAGFKRESARNRDDRWMRIGSFSPETRWSALKEPRRDDVKGRAARWFPPEALNG